MHATYCSKRSTRRHVVLASKVDASMINEFDSFDIGLYGGYKNKLIVEVESCDIGSDCASGERDERDFYDATNNTKHCEGMECSTQDLLDRGPIPILSSHPAIR